jgi:hypothetical protein
VQAEVSDAANEKISNDEIEKAPRHIDGRRRKSLPRRFGKRALKGASHQAADDVGNCIAKKHPAEKIANDIQPIHRSASLPSVKGLAELFVIPNAFPGNDVFFFVSPFEIE